MAGIIGADNQFGKDFGHPTAGLQGTILAVYEVRHLEVAIGEVHTDLYP